MRSSRGRISAIAALVCAVLLAAGLAVACGGGEEAERTPQAYARSFCGAFGKHAEGLREFMVVDRQEIGADIETGRKIISDGSQVLEDLAKDLEKIGPPRDIEQLHEEIVFAFSNGAEVLRKFDGLFDKPLTEIMKEIEALEPQLEDVAAAFDALENLPTEYEAAFESEPKCQEVAEIFGEF